MFFQHTEHGAATAAPAAEHAAAGGGHAAESGAHHVPGIVEFVNYYVGEPVHHFQVTYTKPLWDKFFGYFGTTAESVFGAYTAENAVPWYTVMIILAALIALALVWVLKP